MASIRRTLSPANHDRAPHSNGSSPSPLSVESPAHKLLSDSKASASFPGVFAGIRRFVAGFSLQKQARRGQQSWRRSIFRCLVFLIVGLLLGLMPLGHVDEARDRDFSFEMKTQTIPVKEREESKVNIDVPQGNEDLVAGVSLSNLGMKDRFDYKTRNLLIVVTPTFNWALQAYYLNRLGQVLALVNPPVLWIVVDMMIQSKETAKILRKMGVMSRHLVCTNNMTDIKDRGVHQRNTALEHIERHKLDGIVYFADDDNIYSLELFERIRNISRFGTWPVAMLAQSKNKAILEGPVCNNASVIGWHTNEKSARLRRFHVDMSGFAFNSTILWDPKRWNSPFLNPVRQLDTVREGFQETSFIEQLVADESQMEGVPGGCDRVMNWHLHLEARNYQYPIDWLLINNLEAVLPLHRYDDATV